MGMDVIKMVDFNGGFKNDRFDDFEVGVGELFVWYLGVGFEENMLFFLKLFIRWGFIRKVYEVFSV